MTKTTTILLPIFLTCVVLSASAKHRVGAGGPFRGMFHTYEKLPTDKNVTGELRHVEKWASWGPPRVNQDSRLSTGACR